MGRAAAWVWSLEVHDHYVRAITIVQPLGHWREEIRKKQQQPLIDTKMMRASRVRLGHQLVHEPLSNVEHNTFARGKMTHGMTTQRMQHHLLVAGSGFAAAMYALFWRGPFTTKTVSATGVMTN